MERTFTFEIGIGPHLWQRDKVSIRLEITRRLHDYVASIIGTDKMARLEFGFNFQQTVAERFPGLDILIHQAIQVQCTDETTDWMEVFYSLQSPWFDD